MTSDRQSATPRLTMAKALAIVAGLLVLSLVVPPALATMVADTRVERARGDLARIAAALSASRAGGGAATIGTVLAGQGRVPKTGDAATSAWLTASRGTLSAQPDPWGNAYLLLTGGSNTDNHNSAARLGAVTDPLAVLILSAGPNGVIETAFHQPGSPPIFGGDDVGLWLRFPWSSPK